MFLSVDEEISYRQDWKLVHQNIIEKNIIVILKILKILQI